MDDGHVTKEKFALPASQRKTGLQNFSGEAWYSMKIIEFYRGNLYSSRSSYSFAVALFSNTTMWFLLPYSPKGHLDQSCFADLASKI